MLEERWDKFVIYVNAYYAVQESCDSARRSWEKPAPGLEAFCRDANPFIWDEPSSADEHLYESFCALFDERFDKRGCTAAEGRELALEWLASWEGETFGTSLVSALEETADELAWAEACGPIERQIRGRAARLERSPQDVPELYPEPAPRTPSQADIEAVIAMLAKGDEEMAAQLRARLDEEPA